MIELIVLLVVVGLVATIAVPRINRESKRMTVENALTSIRGAVTETGMRARSTGKALSLKLMPGDNQFLVEESEQNLAMTWVPPANSALSKAEDDGSRSTSPPSRPTICPQALIGSRRTTITTMKTTSNIISIRTVRLPAVLSASTWPDGIFSSTSTA